MLFRRSAEAEERALTAIGGAFVLSLVLVAGVLWANPFRDRPKPGAMSVTFDVSFTAPGIGSGTPIILHGVQIGEVTDSANRSDGGVRLETRLRTPSELGLTDAATIDFRPANYFGVSALNISPGVGGEPLREGSVLVTEPKGNFSMQALLTHVNELSAGVLTPEFVGVIDRATELSDAMNPFLETMVTVGATLAAVQDTSTAKLLANVTSIGAVTPVFIDATTRLVNTFMDSKAAELPKELLEGGILKILDSILDAMFGRIGRLEGSHIDDLLPLVNSVKALSDVVPGLIVPVGVSDTLVGLRSRLETMWGHNAEQPALNVRVILDQFPAIGSAVGISGGPR